MSFPQLDLLFQDVMKNTGIQGLSLDESGSCSLRLKYQGMPLVHLSYAAASDELYIFSEVGFVPEEKEVELLRVALEDNLFWKNGRGAVFARSAETGRLMLQQRNAVSLLNAATLEENLAAFIEMLYNARLRLFRKDTAGEAPSGGILSPDMLRV